MRLSNLSAAVIVGFVLCVPGVGLRAAGTEQQVGVSAVDVTPDYPVRLSGFGFRRAESEGVTQKIWAKAIAFGGDDASGGPAVIVTVDNVGVPEHLRRDVAARLEKKAKLDPARFAITSSHTHTAPMLSGMLETLFGEPVPPEHQARIDRYTKELADHIEQAALLALADRRPATVAFGVGAADLAVNRRAANGPVDHDLPLLAVRDPDGKLRAVYVSYACHCVTLSNNKISGDWAGYVQEMIQQNHPGTVALTSIGCGADANPRSGVVGDKVDVAVAQGKQIAAEVDRLLGQDLAPITEPPAAQHKHISLPFDSPPSREQLQKTAEAKDAVGYHARVQLAKLDRGEKLQTELPYLIQTWTFGDQLAMVFLPGEVVVDYSLRLKQELDRNRLWVNAYANDVPCYIPSERVLKEGGYEGGDAMVYYNRPTRFAPGLEQKIIDEVHRQLPDGFAAPKGTEGVPPKTPEQSRRAIRTKPGLDVELVAAEPLIASPVAIDWGADGRLWVCEMFDYPTGVDENWQPGGRVKFLQDTDGDGQYDKATVFLENVAFPTGVTAWGRGVFVCAAPDILYAEDTNGDGRADKVDRLFSGFATDNYQARVNGLSLGLDNWIYGANGLLGGVIEDAAKSRRVDIRNRDFRFRPLSGPLETVTGYTQQGRVRDDWGRWFGCDNSNALLYYPHEERYLARNPHAPAPAPVVNPPADYDAGRLYPASRLLARYNDFDQANRVTSAGGLGIYRDTLLGDKYAGNAFTCEAVHNLVHRMILTGDGPDLARRRGDGERESEFLASTDNWFRPVQVRTGPDGALYVVDIYRFLIEHPRWIPAQRLAQIDARAGASMGRIYRLRPTGQELRPVRDLTKLGGAGLAAALDTPSGTDRDRVHVELLTRKDRAAAVPPLEKLAATAALPQVRLQALCALDGLGGTTATVLERSLKDSDPRVRQHAVRLCENPLRGPASPEAERLGAVVLGLADDESPTVRRQLALTLGEWNDPKAGEVLARLAENELADAAMRTAVLSSAGRHSGAVLAAVLAAPADAAGRAEWVAPLVATAAGSEDEALLARAVSAVLPPADADPTPTHLTALAALLEALDRKGTALSTDLAARPELRDAGPRVSRTLTAARRLAADEAAPPAVRAPAIRLLGRGDATVAEINLLCDLLIGGGSDEVRAATLAALRRHHEVMVAEWLLDGWRQAAPAARADVINLLLGREAWSRALLAAVRSGRVGRGEIPLADRQHLLSAESEELRKDAAATFPSGPAGSRADVLARFRSVAALAGDPAKGAEPFALNCAACHRLGGVGHPVGPDLAALRDKDADYFVQNILDPSAVVEPRFVGYQVLTKDRRTLSGVITAETPTGLTLATGGGTTETVARGDVKQIRATGRSMMPEGFEAAFTPEQMADLIAHIKSSGPPPKQFAGNTPQPVTAAADGSLLLPASHAEIRGGPITLESEFKNIGMWQGQDDHVVWTIGVEKGGEFDVHFDYACAENSAGNTFRLTAGDASLEGTVEATGPDWSRYRQAKIGTLRLAPGRHRLSIRPAGPLRGALIDLRTVALTPTGIQPKWPAAPRPAVAVPADGVARDPAAVAAVILDPAQPQAAREAAVAANPQFSAQLIVELTRDLKPGTPAEYQRIPWIWRVAILCGKRNDSAAVRRVLSVSLPEADQPLRDWQAVVIGGGIINGISQRGDWPAVRVDEVLGDDQALRRRWARSLDLASAMADDEKVPTGTRYDALRMLGAEPWEKRAEQLVRYLVAGTNPELQMGAVSGLADVDAPGATAALVGAVPALTDQNRELALDALLRTEARTGALLDAVAVGKVDAALLGPARTERLTTHADEKLRARAAGVLKGR